VHIFAFIMCIFSFINLFCSIIAYVKKHEISRYYSIVAWACFHGISLIVQILTIALTTSLVTSNPTVISLISVLIALIEGSLVCFLWKAYKSLKIDDLSKIEISDGVYRKEEFSWKENDLLLAISEFCLKKYFRVKINCDAKKLEKYYFLKNTHELFKNCNLHLKQLNFHLNLFL
jgi:hypothetical protein